MSRDCKDCRHAELLMDDTPCSTCIFIPNAGYTNWTAPLVEPAKNRMTDDGANVVNSKHDLTPEQIACLQQGGLVYGRNAQDWGVGMRFNVSKPPVWRGFISYFPRAIEAVSKVSEFGAKKYDWNNWQQLEDGATNCTDSLVRHLINEAKGRTLDVDSEELEAAHAAWNAMARLEFICKEREAKAQT